MSVIPEDWQKLISSIESLTAQIKVLNENLPHRPKRYLYYEDCIPPADFCKAVCDTMNAGKFYGRFIWMLADYYGCPNMGLYADEDRVGKNALATYYASHRAAYTKYPHVKPYIVVHEFFHHMYALGVVILRDNELEEVMADRFAKEFLARAGVDDKVV